MVELSELLNNAEHAESKGYFLKLNRVNRALSSLHLMYSALNTEFIDSAREGSDYSGSPFQYTDEQLDNAFMDDFAVILTGKETPGEARDQFDSEALRGYTLRSRRRLESGRLSASEMLGSGIYELIRQGESGLTQALQESTTHLEGTRAELNSKLVRAGIDEDYITRLLVEYRRQEDSDSSDDGPEPDDGAE
jgi:hypothetical protein|tara:strand:- start:1899 stop:2477 length:579 start_codon:yes stop_codon:yes gene_type:complete